MRTSLLTAIGITPAYALKLLVSSYGPAWNESGAVQILNHKANSTTLSIAHTNLDCGTMSTWLDMTLGEGRVTCIDEANPGSINLLSIKPNDSITKLSSIKTVGGPVSTAFFDQNGTVALAHYSPPAVTTFNVRANNNTFAPLQNFNMTFPTGPNKNRQDTAHIHQAITDPTGKFIICPNLGSDLVHVFGIDPATNLLTAHTPLTAKPGYGPRHAHFWQPKSNCKDTFLLIVNELSNRLTSYKVTYLQDGGLSFEEVDDVSTYGDRMPLAEATAAEIAESPDNKFIVVSNRNAPVSAPNPDPNNSTAIMSDSIATFKPTEAGKLEFVELAMSGGVAPRHFSLNKDGSMIAVANGATQNVVVFSRDIETGKLGKVVAYAPKVGNGQLTNVQWLEN